MLATLSSNYAGNSHHHHQPLQPPNWHNFALGIRRSVLGACRVDLNVARAARAPALASPKMSQAQSDDPEWAQDLPEDLRTWLSKNVFSFTELTKAELCCSACAKKLHYDDKRQVKRHASLHVALCSRCQLYLESGEWTKDEEGFDNYCLVCGNGGRLVLCDKCPHAYCTRCLKRFLGREAITQIQDDSAWTCLKCDPMQMKESIGMVYSLEKYWASKKADGDDDVIGNMFQMFEDVVLHTNRKALDGLKEKLDKLRAKQDQSEEKIVKELQKGFRKLIRDGSENLKLLDQRFKDFGPDKRLKYESSGDELDDEETLSAFSADNALAVDASAHQSKSKEGQQESSLLKRDDFQAKNKSNFNVGDSPNQSDTEEQKLCSEKGDSKPKRKNISAVKESPEKSKSEEQESSIEKEDSRSKRKSPSAADASPEKSVSEEHRKQAFLEKGDSQPESDDDVENKDDDDQNGDQEKEKTASQAKRANEKDDSDEDDSEVDFSEFIDHTQPEGDDDNENKDDDDKNGDQEKEKTASQAKRANEKDDSDEDDSEVDFSEFIDHTQPEGDDDNENKDDDDKNGDQEKEKTASQAKRADERDEDSDEDDSEVDFSEFVDHNNESTPDQEKNNKEYSDCKAKGQPKPLITSTPRSAKASVLATSESDNNESDDNNVAVASQSKKKIGSAKMAVLATSSDESESNVHANSDTDDSHVPAMLHRRYKQLIERIDLEKDSKLNQSIGLSISVQSLSKNILQKIKAGNGSISMKECPELYMKREPRRQFNEDAEIARLCNITALSKKRKTKRKVKSEPESSSDEDDDEKPKKSLSERKSTRRERPKKVVKKLADMSSDEDPNAKRVFDESDSDIFDDKSSSEFFKGPEKAPISGAQLAKAAVLASSDDSDCYQGKRNGVISSSEDSDVPLKAKVKKEPKKKGARKLKEANSSEEEVVPKKKRRAMPNFYTCKLSETDSSDAEEKARERRKRKEEKQKRSNGDKGDSEDEFESRENNGNNGHNGNDDDDDQGDKDKKRKRKRKRKTQINSDEEEDEDEDEDENASSSDSEIDARKKRRKKIKTKSSSGLSDSDSDLDKPKKKKRRRIKNNSSDENEEDSPNKSGRKHIRKIIKDTKLSNSSKEAAFEERDRRRRMEEKQKEYNKIFDTKSTEKSTLSELVLDFDSEKKEKTLMVDSHLVKELKPHQAKGIKFMFDSVFESKAKVLQDEVPGGAILAHCMGLGKTLQTISLVHTMHKNFPEQIAKIMILCPVNTVKNWADEFEKWLSGPLKDSIDVLEMSSEKDNWARCDKLKFWQRNGGALIMGYDMFRNLAQDSKKFKNKQRLVFQSALLDPGPDMVVCDEGHVLKNLKSALNKVMNQIKTKRRIILTGTPLQNNLNEYFAMVNFVKENLLGTFHEFKNRFANPITNGQHSDSTERDVRIMKKRSFILNDLLKGCMQRLDYNVLVPYLQPKHEYVLCIQLTDFQKKLYQHYLNNFAQAGRIGRDGKLEGGRKGGLFYDVQNLSRVWNHPYILEMAKERADQKLLDEDDDNFIDDEDAGSLKDFIDDGSAVNESTSEEDELIAEIKKKATRSQRKAAGEDAEELVSGLEEVRKEELANSSRWWDQFLDDTIPSLESLELGSKMILLMDILKECELLGDKVLVFSQSLLSLDLIQEFLKQVDETTEKSDTAKDCYFGRWRQGADYYRLDGSTPPETRKRWCNYFNNPKHHRTRLFLISTKAGGLGINLVGANRVIIFDASWNPAHDVQSIFRVYRFGQNKPVYIYRFLAKGTMEEKIYDRQVTKQSLSARVVDEQQIERHFSQGELAELYEFKDEPQSERPVPNVPKDRLLAEIIKKHEKLIWKFHDHDSLLENQVDENLTEEERKSAWEEFENEKKGFVNFGSNQLQAEVMESINPQAIQAQYRQQYPHLTEEQIIQATRAYIMQLQSGIHRKPAYDRSHYQQEMAKAKAREKELYPGMFRNQPRQLTGAGVLYSNQMVATAPIAGSSINPVLNRLTAAQQLELQRQYQKQQQLQQRQQQQQHVHALMQQRLEDQIRYQQQQRRQQISQQPEEVEEIVLDGSPETEDVITINSPPSSSSSSSSARPRGRRGRPRLDPDDDDVISTPRDMDRTVNSQEMASRLLRLHQSANGSDRQPEQ